MGTLKQRDLNQSSSVKLDRLLLLCPGAEIIMILLSNMADFVPCDRRVIVCCKRPIVSIARLDIIPSSGTGRPNPGIKHLYLHG